MALEIMLGVLGLGVAGYAASARVIRQFERGVVFRLGRVQEPPRAPGLTGLVPVVDRLRKVNMQISPCRCPRRTGSPATT